MAIADESARSAQRYWSVPLARALVALAAGAAVTFSADHTPSFGLAVFGGFAVLSGVIAIVLTGSRLPVAPRGLLIGAGAVTVLAGAAAVLALGAPSLTGLVGVVAAWAIVSGALEFTAGMRARGAAAPVAAAGRDWRFVGAATAVLGIVFLLLPPHPVVTVGLVGAYAVILGVYLAIAGFSLKWAGGTAHQTMTDGGPR